MTPSKPRDVHPSASAVEATPAERLCRAVATAVEGSPATRPSGDGTERTSVKHSAAVVMMWDELAALDGVSLEEATDWLVDDWARSRTARMTFGGHALVVEVGESWHPRDIVNPPRGIAIISLDGTAQQRPVRAAPLP